VDPSLQVKLEPPLAPTAISTAAMLAAKNTLTIFTSSGQ
jgi:hypothetical protein